MERFLPLKVLRGEAAFEVPDDGNAAAIRLQSSFWLAGRTLDDQVKGIHDGPAPRC